jgi:peptidoglycan/xylan/chitin deacetylase (PgdA/CDA1 family)
MIPWICCIVFFVKIHSLSAELQTTSDKLEAMNGLLLEQQILLQSIPDEPMVNDNEVLQELADDVEFEQSVTEPEKEDVTEDYQRKVYLTFDDGPSIYTEDILDILDQYNVKATFFVTGKDDARSRDAIKEIVARGHSLGMHSYSHDYNEIYSSVDNFAADYMRLKDYLYELTGVESKIYRFPGGSSNTVSDTNMRDFAAYLEGEGIVFFDWNISSGDGGSILLSTQRLIDNSTSGIENWDESVILLHDSAEKRTTVEALPEIIENILALENTVILPITEDTEPVQHISN